MGKPLSICGVCHCDPCDCHGVMHMQFVRLTYWIGAKSFTLQIPKRLVDQYKSLYDELEVMDADGRVVVYSSGAVVKEKSNEKQ